MEKEILSNLGTEAVISKNYGSFNLDPLHSMHLKCLSIESYLKSFG